MGLPVKQRKSYLSHKKRWDKSTIVEEAVLVKNYALKNKKEIRKVELMVSKFKKLAKSFNKSEEIRDSEQAKSFIENLKAKGFLPSTAHSLDDVLNIKVENVLDRRLSNIVYKNKLARSPAQARQFVVHRHVRVGEKIVDSPSYLVSLAEEPLVTFKETSTLFSEEHPERKLAEEGIVEEVSKEIEVSDSLVNKGGKSPSDLKEEALDDEELDEVLE
jgi:small subunit ribosomal protein S4